MTTPATATASPLARWWHDHPLRLNEVCIAATGGHVSRASDLRRLLREVARGDARIDDRRLRAVVGAMIRSGLVELVREHRAWEATR